MSINVDPREVLEHLEYLGYHNVTKEQLKEFIKDLKKLIKYDQRRDRKKCEEDIRPSSRYSDMKPVACEIMSHGLTSHRKSDGASDAPEQSRVPVQENINQASHFSAQHSPRHVCFNEKTPCSGTKKNYYPSDYDEDGTKKEDYFICSRCNKSDEERVLNSLKPSVRKENIEPPTKSCPSYIRPAAHKLTKCDPVALYHYYQSQWAARPLPGEDPRSDLRWQVRNKMAQASRPTMPRANSATGFHRKKMTS